MIPRVVRAALLLIGLGALAGCDHEIATVSFTGTSGVIDAFDQVDPDIETIPGHRIDVLFTEQLFEMPAGVAVPLVVSATYEPVAGVDYEVLDVTSSDPSVIDVRRFEESVDDHEETFLFHAIKPGSATLTVDGPDSGGEAVVPVTVYEQKQP